MKQLNYNKLQYGVNVLDDDYYGFKKLMGAIAQLVFPKGTRVMKSRNNMIGKTKYKLRADQAITIMIVPRDTVYFPHRTTYRTLAGKVYASSMFYRATKSRYRLGKLIVPNGFNTDIYESCGKGVHFFCTLKEAENY